jgi:hypothetical protein
MATHLCHHSHKPCGVWCVLFRQVHNLPRNVPSQQLITSAGSAAQERHEALNHHLCLAAAAGRYWGIVCCKRNVPPQQLITAAGSAAQKNAMSSSGSSSSSSRF